MRRVLIVDDDRTALDAINASLPPRGIELVAAKTGRDGVLLGCQLKPALALIALRLPDGSGIEVLRQLIRGTPSTVCVLVSSAASTAATVEAMRLGASNGSAKPLIAHDIVRLIECVCSEAGEPTDGVERERPHLHSTHRWAEVVVRAVESPSDPRTLHELSRCVGISVGAFRNWCRTARLSSRQSLLFTRVLRAVIQHQIHAAAPEDLLNIVDRRTLAKVLDSGGGASGRLPTSEREFLDRQKFIDDDRAVEAVRRALGARQGSTFRADVSRPAPNHNSHRPVWT